MNARTPSLLLAILFFCLTHSGCFNPDYGDGGFLCGSKDAPCPEGYTCDSTGVCRKSGTNPGVLTCAPKKVVDNVPAAQMNWALALDSDKPSIFFIGSGGQVGVAVHTPKGWEIQEVKTSKGNVMTDRLTAAVDDVGNSVLVYADTSTKPANKPARIYRNHDDAPWSEPELVDASLKGETEGLAMDSNSQTLFLAVTGKDPGGSSTPGLLEFYLWDGATHKFGLAESIPASAELSKNIRLSVGPKRVVYTGAQSKQWEMVSFFHTKDDKPTHRTWPWTVGKVFPLNVVVTDNDRIFLAHGREGAGHVKSLFLYSWTGTDATPATMPLSFQGSLDPYTLALASAPQSDMLVMSLMHNKNSVSIFEMGGTTQQLTSIHQGSSTTATQVKIDNKNNLHLVWDKSMDGKNSLYYFSCPLNKK